MLAVAIVLLPGLVARADTYVEGPVSGNWDDPTIIYRVSGDIIVEEGETLTISSGVQIIFEGLFSFNIMGRLNIEGTPEFNVRIYSNGFTWRGMVFAPYSNGQIQFCNISNAWVGIQAERATLNIQYSSIDAISIGISCIQSNLNIQDNKLIRARGNQSAQEVKAIFVDSRSYPTISHNELIEAIGSADNSTNTYGIYVRDSSPVIEDNWIEVSANNYNNSATGVYVNRSPKIVIQKNIIRVNSISEMRDIWLVLSTNVQIIRNDLFLMTTCENARGVHVDEESRVEILTNNIIYGNGLSTGLDCDENHIDVDRSGYNDFFNHRTNYSGDWWDGNHDIYADPLFVSHSQRIEDCNYNLTWNDWPNYDLLKSPCIDAGNPAINDDAVYRTQSDIGKFTYIYDPAEYDPPNRVGEDSVPSSIDIVSTYPNPFNRATMVSLNLALPGQADINVFDLNGRHITTLWSGPMSKGFHRLVWSAEGFSAGEYLIRCNLPGDVTQTRRVNFLP